MAKEDQAHIRVVTTVQGNWEKKSIEGKEVKLENIKLENDEVEKGRKGKIGIE